MWLHVQYYIMLADPTLNARLWKTCGHDFKEKCSDRADYAIIRCLSSHLEDENVCICLSVQLYVCLYMYHCVSLSVSLTVHVCHQTQLCGRKHAVKSFLHYHIPKYYICI